MSTKQQQLHQWFTPAWAAEAIVEQEFGWLKPGDVVLEPACGDGAFLCAIPSYVNAIGCEIDPEQAQRARASSGRRVVCDNFLVADLDLARPVDAVIGNPPFSSDLVAAFLRRSHALLRDGGEVGFILPAYILQTSSKVEMLGRDFSIHQSLLPRNLFPGLKLPLVFAKFVKEQERRLFGFLLYASTQEIASLKSKWRERLASARTRGGVWFAVVDEVVAELGGEAELSQIYKAIEGRRPTPNPAWQEQVRKVVQCKTRFVRTGAARYARRCAVDRVALAA